MRPWFSPSTVTKRARLPQRGMAVDDLACQHGLARARRTLDHVKPATQKTAAQDRVEARHMAWNPLDLSIAIAAALASCSVMSSPISVCRCERQRHGKGRSLAQAARYGDPAIHGCDQTIGDPQAEAEAAASMMSHDLLEASENARLLIG